MANLYFRRFILAWKKFGHECQLIARVVNYADDLVICCRPGNGREAMEVLRSLMTRLDLTVNERKSRLVKVPQKSFDFLGYTIGRFFGNGGRSFIGIKPSKKAARRLRRRIHDETCRRWDCLLPQERIRVLNSILRGWCGYFNHGHVLPPIGCSGTGYRRYPLANLYQTLGWYDTD